MLGLTMGGFIVELGTLEEVELSRLFYRCLAFALRREAGGAVWLLVAAAKVYM